VVKIVVTASGLQYDFQQALKYGEQVRFRYFSISGGSGAYDDDIVITQSGTDTWTTGLVQPLSPGRSSHDAVLMAQGKILQNDIKVYVDGAFNTSGTWRVGIGSANPPTREYSMLPEGTVAWGINGSIVYKTLYVRALTTGSMIGE
jgi:hypothetical protein